MPILGPSCSNGFRQPSISEGVWSARPIMGVSNRPDGEWPTADENPFAGVV
jgi:hypothetical protein